MSEVLYVRSSKKKSGLSSGDDTSTNDEDIWDDTLLIEAYDKAVTLAKNEVLRKIQNSEGKNPASQKKKKSKETSWQIGDKCKCRFSEDNCFYEADVIDIIEGIGMCIVRYVGYENEEKVPLKNLLPSDGEPARALQVKAALGEDVGNVQLPTESEKNYGAESQYTQKKKSKEKKKDQHKHKQEKANPNVSNGFFNTMNFPPPHPSINMAIPPPPPPHLFNYNENEQESEAMSAMLMSWYMSGYHTGYYQGLKSAKNQ